MPGHTRGGVTYPNPKRKKPDGRECVLEFRNIWLSLDKYKFGKGDWVNEVGEGRMFILCRTSSPGKGL